MGPQNIVVEIVVGSDIPVGNKFLVDSYFVLWGRIVTVSVGVLMGLGDRGLGDGDLDWSNDNVDILLAMGFCRMISRSLAVWVHSSYVVLARIAICTSQGITTLNAAILKPSCARINAAKSSNLSRNSSKLSASGQKHN